MIVPATVVAQAGLRLGDELAAPAALAPPVSPCGMPPTSPGAVIVVLSPFEPSPTSDEATTSARTATAAGSDLGSEEC
jgi:hypothetical protein